MRLSANQHKHTPWEDNIGTHISIKHGGFAEWLEALLLKNNLPNAQEIHWIREMLRQGMFVGRHATATYIEVVVQWRHIFFIRYGTRTGFSLVQKPNRKPNPYTGARG